MKNQEKTLVWKLKQRHEQLTKVSYTMQDHRKSATELIIEEAL
jgi:hypothetical protein